MSGGIFRPLALGWLRHRPQSERAGAPNAKAPTTACTATDSAPTKAEAMPDSTTHAGRRHVSSVRAHAMTDLAEVVSEHGIEALADRIEAIAAAMSEHGNPFTSHVGRELLCYAGALRQARVQGDMNLVVVTALRLGALEQEIRMLDGPWLTGVKVILGGVKGARQRQPSNYNELRRAYRAYKEVHPRCPTNGQAYRAVAKICGVSEHTVRRAVTGH